MQFGRTCRTPHGRPTLLPHALISSSRTWLRHSLVHGANAAASAFPGWRPVVASDTWNRVSCVVAFATTISCAMQRPEIAICKVCPQNEPTASAVHQRTSSRKEKARIVTASRHHAGVSLLSRVMVHATHPLQHIGC